MPKSSTELDSLAEFSLFIVNTKCEDEGCIILLVFRFILKVILGDSPIVNCLLNLPS